MAVTGVNTKNKDMRLLAKELHVNGVAITITDPATAITDVTVTGTYATDDDAIETAINSILAVLRANNLIAT